MESSDDEIKNHIQNVKKFTEINSDKIEGQLEEIKLLSNEPSECLGAYVISMTTSASDILSVVFLQKEAKIKDKLRSLSET